eukprot:COSAG04_NODE_977_length_9041_cov_4.994520_5_plen_96_part_00
MLCSELDRTELQKLRREAKNKKAAEELAADGATYLKREDSTKALAKYKAAVKKDPKNAGPESVPIRRDSHSVLCDGHILICTTVTNDYRPWELIT